MYGFVANNVYLMLYLTLTELTKTVTELDTGTLHGIILYCNMNPVKIYVYKQFFVMTISYMLRIYATRKLYPIVGRCIWTMAQSLCALFWGKGDNSSHYVLCCGKGEMLKYFKGANIFPSQPINGVKCFSFSDWCSNKILCHKPQVPILAHVV